MGMLRGNADGRIRVNFETGVQRGFKALVPVRDRQLLGEVAWP